MNRPSPGQLRPVGHQPGSLAALKLPQEKTLRGVFVLSHSFPLGSILFSAWPKGFLNSGNIFRFRFLIIPFRIIIIPRSFLIFPSQIGAFPARGIAGQCRHWVPASRPSLVPSSWIRFPNRATPPVLAIHKNKHPGRSIQRMPRPGLKKMIQFIAFWASRK